MKYDLIVYIGRFQPFHDGHEFVLNQAIDLADEVLVLVGSANKPRSSKNPFSYLERVKMIQQHYDVWVQPLNDYDYNDFKWVEGVKAEVAKFPNTKKVGIIGFDKDESSYYLKAFPEWELVEAEPFFNRRCSMVSATDIREHFFHEHSIGNVPEATSIIMHKFWNTKLFEHLQEEYNSIESYKKSWEFAPFPPVFVTADALITSYRKVLLIKRGKAPGKGLWALPGGFLDADTDPSIQAAMFRELEEETGLTPEKVRVTRQMVFDSLSRGERGRTITQVVHCVVRSSKTPEVTGSDDAETAAWIRLDDLDQGIMYADHYGIINAVLALG